MNLHTFDELDDMACKLLECEIELITVASLIPTERLGVLGLAFAMALCKLGVLSRGACAAFKRRIYRENKQFAVEFNHLYTIYDRWIADTRDTSVLRSAYDKAMRNNQEHEALGLSSVIIGKLTGEGNVHYQLYEKYCTDEDCKVKTEQSARDLLDNMDDVDSRLPYSTIVDSLFKFYKPEKMAKLWEQLGVDYPEPNTINFIKSTPTKCDNTRWAVDMVNEICENSRKTKIVWCAGKTATARV